MSELLRSPENLTFMSGAYGVCSDLHLGSLYFDHGEFLGFLENISRQGARMIISAGDVLEANDLQEGRTSVDTYREHAHLVAQALQRYDLKVVTILGNHDLRLRASHPEVFAEIQRILGPVVSFYEERSLRLSFGRRDIVVVHDPAGVLSLKTDTAIVGHTHIPGVKDSIINPGGFRRHYVDKVTCGGLLLKFFGDSSFALSRFGEKDVIECGMIADLHEMGFGTGVVVIEEGHPRYPLLRYMVEELRNIDPEAIVWLTGSSAGANWNGRLGKLNTEYKVLRDEMGQPISIMPVEKSRYLYAPISDIDFEIISNVLTKEELDGVLQKVRSSKHLPRPTKIEASCYRPADILPYLELYPKSAQHNYFHYRFLLAPVAVADPRSYQELDMYLRMALYSMNSLLERTGGPLNQLFTIRTALGYRDFKVYKQELKVEGREYRILPGTPMYDYIQAKSLSGATIHPPYSNPDSGSFKLVRPDTSYLDQEIPAGRRKLVITTPLSGYTPELHLGQLISVAAGSALGRYLDADYNPYTFQVTGPYWDNQNYSLDEIGGVIDRNIGEITSQLGRLGFDGKVVKDNGQFVERWLQRMFQIWDGLGLIEFDGDTPYFRVGAAISLYGGEGVLLSSNMPSLLATVRDYEARLRRIAIPPENGGDLYSRSYCGRPVYPTYSILPLPYRHRDNDEIAIPSSAEVVCGVNVSTQFAIPHALFLRTFGVGEVTRHTAMSLVVDENGRRMSRKNGNTIFLPSLLGHIKTKTNVRRITERPSDVDSSVGVQAQTLLSGPEEAFVARFVLLRLFRLSSQRKYDQSLVDQAFRTLGWYKEIRKIAIERGFRGLRQQQLPVDFQKALDRREIGIAAEKFMLHVKNFLQMMAQKNSNTKPIDIESAYSEVERMAWILFGNVKDQL